MEYIVMSAYNMAKIWKQIVENKEKIKELEKEIKSLKEAIKNGIK